MKLQKIKTNNLLYLIFLKRALTFFALGPMQYILDIKILSNRYSFRKVNFILIKIDAILYLALI
jgi:hypothetical protein